MTNASRDQQLTLLITAWTIGLMVSGWHPFDRATWLMEIAPVLIAMPVLWATRHRLPLTPLALSLIAVHGIVLMVGGRVQLCAGADRLRHPAVAGAGSQSL